MRAPSRTRSSPRITPRPSNRASRPSIRAPRSATAAGGDWTAAGADDLSPRSIGIAGGADGSAGGGMWDRGGGPPRGRLRAQGTFAPLATTVPAESPVSWASLNSGQNPAKTGIPGFVKRVIRAGRDPQPRVGFYDEVERDTSSLKLSPLLRFLVSFEPATAGLLAGLAVIAAFALLFVFLLRIRKSVALPLALVLGAAGAWAAHKASAEVPR